MTTIRKLLAAVSKHSPLFAFRKKSDTPLLYAPGTKILYDTGLVSKLKNDHAQLVEVYTRITGAIEQRDYEKLHRHLEAFLALFNAHALTEYTKLYVFLDYSFRSDQRNHDTILRFRREMNEIGKAVRKFAHHWRTNGISDASLPTFKHQLHQIGAVLTKRIEVEETQLYEIYNKAPSRFGYSAISH